MISQDHFYDLIGPYTLVGSKINFVESCRYIGHEGHTEMLSHTLSHMLLGEIFRYLPVHFQSILILCHQLNYTPENGSDMNHKVEENEMLTVKHSSH